MVGKKIQKEGLVVVFQTMHLDTVQVIDENGFFLGQGVEVLVEKKFYITDCFFDVELTF